jgi:hypothetical protein
MTAGPVTHEYENSVGACAGMSAGAAAMSGRATKQSQIRLSRRAEELATADWPAPQVTDSTCLRLYFRKKPIQFRRRAEGRAEGFYNTNPIRRPGRQWAAA